MADASSKPSKPRRRWFQFSLRRWFQFSSGILFKPRYRLIWSAVSCAVTVTILLVDLILRYFNDSSPFAPTFLSLLAATGLGASLGLIGLVWERFLLTRKRSWMLSFHSSSLRERTGWRHQRWNIILNGWFLALFLGLLAWCTVQNIFVLPPVCAANAFAFAGNRRLVADFYADLSFKLLMTDASSDPNKPRRRFQFNLSTLLIVVTLAAVLMVAWRVHTEPYRRQLEVMTYIEELGGEYETARSAFGPLFIIEISLSGNKVTDADLAHLEGLTTLKSLDLGETQVTDAGLAHLKGLTTLRDLNLDDTQVSDAGLAHLKGLTNLRWFSIHNNSVSDAGLVHLKGLKNLFILGLHGTQVSEAGVKKLQKALPNCMIIHSP